MKVDETAFISFDAPEVAVRVKLADASVLRLRVSLHIQSPLSLVVFKLTPGGTEGIAQSHIWVLVRVRSGVRASDRDLFTGNRDVDAKVE